jgi:hypothetical protein
MYKKGGYTRKTVPYTLHPETPFKFGQLSYEYLLERKDLIPIQIMSCT